MSTSEEWKNKLKSLVPNWVLSPEGSRANAVIAGMSKILADFQSDVEKNIKQTFIKKSTNDYLALHGKERNKLKLTAESVDGFRTRIINIKNNSDSSNLEALIDGVLGENSSKILTSQELMIFLNGESFVGHSLSSKYGKKNIFYVVVSKTDLSQAKNIISIVENQKAFGTSWVLQS